MWLELGEEPNLTRVLTCVYEDLTGHAASAGSDEDLAQRIGDELAACAAFLVIDDVWTQAPLDLVLARTGHVPRLVTTRNAALAEGWDPVLIAVDDALQPGEAIGMITPGAELSAGERAAVARVAGKLGGWPLLLALAGAYVPPALEAQRAELEPQVVPTLMAQVSVQVSPAEVRQLLEEAAAFMPGLQWTRAKTALVRLLIELGPSDTALEQARATWPDKPPARVIAAILPFVGSDVRGAIAAALLTEVWDIEEPMARADALAALLPEIAGADYQRALRDIEDAIRDRIAADSAPDAASELTELLGAASATRQALRVLNCPEGPARRQPG